MFSNYRKSKVNTPEAIDLGNAISTSVTKHLSSDTFLNRNIQQIGVSIASIMQLQSRTKSNELTDTLASQDTARDDLNAALEMEVEAKERQLALFPQNREAVTTIKKALEATPVDIRAGYAEESNQLNTRLLLLKKEENQTHLTNLGLLPLYTALESEQKQFNTIKSEKDALESKKLRGTIRTHGKELLERIDFSLSYLYAQSMDQVDGYTEPAAEIGEAITRIMTQANARETRREAE